MEYFRPKRRIIETWLKPNDLIVDRLIMPYFIVDGKNKKQVIPGMPGIYKFSVDILIQEIDHVLKRGITSIILFETSEDKSERVLISNDNLMARCIRSIKTSFPELTLISDLCVCSHTGSGHCRLTENGKIDTKKTIKTLKGLAVLYGEMGADILSPSSMLKGQTEEIRDTLDGNGLSDVALMPVLKFASSLYQPARRVFLSNNELNTLKSYHLSINNRDTAVKWCKTEEAEGADIIMIKPALNNLDIICKTKEAIRIPVAGYQPSGNYALLKSGLKGSEIKEKELVLEELTSIVRAGAEKISTYHAREIGSWFKD